MVRGGAEYGQKPPVIGSPGCAVGHGAGLRSELCVGARSRRLLCCAGVSPEDRRILTVLRTSGRPPRLPGPPGKSPARLVAVPEPIRRVRIGVF